MGLQRPRGGGGGGAQPVHLLFQGVRVGSGGLLDVRVPIGIQLQRVAYPAPSPRGCCRITKGRTTKGRTVRRANSC